MQLLIVLNVWDNEKEEIHAWDYDEKKNESNFALKVYERCRRKIFYDELWFILFHSLNFRCDNKP